MCCSIQVPSRGLNLIPSLPLEGCTATWRMATSWKSMHTTTSNSPRYTGEPLSIPPSLSRLLRPLPLLTFTGYNIPATILLYSCSRALFCPWQPSLTNMVICGHSLCQGCIVDYDTGGFLSIEVCSGYWVPYAGVLCPLGCHTYGSGVNLLAGNSSGRPPELYM